MQRHTTEQARRRQQSGSTPHDLITADQRALPDLFLLARRPPRSSSHSCAQFAQNCARKYPAQPTAHSSAPTRSHWLHCKIVSARLTFAVRHCRSRPQISIAFLSRRPPAAPKAHYLPTRFRALALFGRRSAEPPALITLTIFSRGGPGEKAQPLQANTAFLAPNLSPPRRPKSLCSTT